MKKIVKQLTATEARAKYEGYMFIEVEERIHPDTKTPYVWHDAFSLDASRVSRALVLETDKLRPYFHLIQLGGGMIKGEGYGVDLIVNDRSKAIFTSQSSNKVLQGGDIPIPTRYDMNLQVGADAMCEMINDSIILYDNTMYEQRVNIYLDKTSTLIYTDIFGPGWNKDELDHQYKMMDLKTKFFVNEKLLLYDNLVFEPQKEDPSGFGIMDKYRRCGTGFFITPKMTDEHIDNVRKIISEEFPNHKNYYEMGISSLGIPSLCVRVLADEIFEIQKIINRIHRYVREEILGLPALNLRKQ